MGKPWNELSSAERLDAILLAVADVEAKRGPWRDATAGTIAIIVGREHEMEQAKFRKRHRSRATRVTPGIVALRRRGLLEYGERYDGMSGGCDFLTEAGYEHVRKLREGTR